MDNLPLHFGKLPKKEAVPLGGDVPVNLLGPLPLEILFDKLFKIQLEIIPHKAQRGVVVPDHQVGVFPHNVNLLNLLAVILLQHLVVPSFVLYLVVQNQPPYLHAVIEDQKSPLQLHRVNLRQV